jgi:CIC family chloride channel protein
MTGQRLSSLLRLGVRLVERLRPTEAHQNLAWAVLVGVVGAAAALFFERATTALQFLFTRHDGGNLYVFKQLSPWLRLIVPTLGGFLAGAVLTFGQRYIRQGATDYMEAITLGDGKVRARSTLYRSLAALFSIASGEAIGKEGPLLQLSAMLASKLGQLRHLPPARLRLLVACGASAGIAAAFNAPIAAALFVAEIVLGSLAMETLGPLIFSSVASIITLQIFDDAHPLYQLTTFKVQIPGINEVLLLGVLGIICGLMACFFLRLLDFTHRLFAKVSWPLTLKLTLGGLFVGLLATYHPEVTGNGSDVVTSLLTNPGVWQAVLLTLAFKMLATSVVFGSGAVGGVFTPTLMVGACTGFLTWAGFHHLFPSFDLQMAAFTTIGMGAMLAAATQAPIMSILMIFEMTQSYEIMIPLMLASVIGYYTVRGFGLHSLYAAHRRPSGKDVFSLPLEAITVADIMQTRPGTAPPTAHFAELARRFLTGGMDRQYVVDADHRLVGVVRLEDLSDYLHSRALADSIIARDIAYEDAPALAPELSLPEALVTFTKAHEHELPVVNKKTCELLGTLSRNDLLLTLAEVGKRNVR